MKTFYLNPNFSSKNLNISSKIPNKRIVKTNFKNNEPPISNFIPVACKDCVYSVNTPPNSDNMVCTLFRYQFAPITYDYAHYVETQICRLDDKLCGPDGTYFKMIKLK